MPTSQPRDESPSSATLGPGGHRSSPRRGPGGTVALVVVAVAVVLALLVAGTLTTQRTAGGAGADAPAAPTEVPQFPVLPGGAGTGATGADRPNVVVVLTDDQNTDELQWMPHTRRLLASEGVTFPRMISPHPLCCPARAELVTGEYGQNNGVHHNGGPHGGYAALDPSAPTVPERLSAAGYRTGFVGKYLNGYESDAPADPRDPSRPRKEPGWDLWEPLTGSVYQYERYSFRGDPEAWRRDRVPYVTDAIARRTDSAVRRMAASDDPFVLFSWHVAPHYRPVDKVHRPPPPAPRDAGKLRDVPAPSLSKPSYNQADVSRQPLDIRKRPVMRDSKNVNMFRGRIRSLQAVDRAVASLVRTLAEVGELDDTYLVFTSDNGYAMGEHRLFGKNVLTREILDVPLVVRGPGIAPGSTSDVPATLVDLPATVLDLAGVDDLEALDGLSLRGPMTGASTSFRDTTLVQTGGASGDGWKYRGVRTDRYLYARDAATGDAVLYDHAADPWELDNVVDDPAYAAVVAELEDRAERLRECAGADCNLRFGPDPAPAG